jgi:hypothetical protein
MDVECQKREIPTHLHQEDRLPDQSFPPTETLYRRIRPEASFESIEDRMAIFSTQQMSVNREKYSRAPEDVLYSSNGPPHLFNWNIA